MIVQRLKLRPVWAVLPSVICKINIQDGIGVRQTGLSRTEKCSFPGTLKILDYLNWSVIRGSNYSWN